MQRPTNNQVGILSVCAVGAFLLFLVYFMLLGGSAFVPAIFKALIVAAIVAAIIYLFVMTTHGREMVGEASTRISAAAVEAKAKIEEKAAEAKAKMDEKATESQAASESAGTVADVPLTDPTPDAPVAETPAPQPTPVSSGADAKPQGLAAPRDGAGDDLKKIKGVGPKLEQTLNTMGYFHFDQIAAWGAAEVAWVDENLEGFKGRVSRDNWVEQAKTLASGGATDFSKKVDGGDVY